MTEVNSEQANVQLQPKNAGDVALQASSGEIQVVAVTFSDKLGSQEYFYFAPKAARAGQYAAVYQQPNSQSESFPFKIVRIVRDNVIDVNGQATKSVWGTFDETFAKAVQLRTEELARVRSQLAIKRRQFEEAKMYTIMAETDPEVAQLLEQLKGFNASV